VADRYEDGLGAFTPAGRAISEFRVNLAVEALFGPSGLWICSRFRRFSVPDSENTFQSN